MGDAVSDYDVFELGDLPLQSGEVLRDAKLAYEAYGTLDDDRSNAVVFPTAYGGTHRDNAWLIGPGLPLDPERYFIVCVNLFGGGLSSSPSNTSGAQHGHAFPHLTVYDNVEAQRRLVLEHFGAREIALVLGFSMGAQQTFHWATREPSLVKRIAPICGSARTADHNIVFLDGIRAVLELDPAFAGGAYDAPPLAGQRAVGRTWAAWGQSQTFYREERWRRLGFDSRDAFVEAAYVDSFASADANDLLAMLWTWRHADVGAHALYGGDTQRALAAIAAKAVVMPSATDTYFPPEDSEREVAAMPNATLATIPSGNGHQAGANVDPDDDAFVMARLRELLLLQ
jgi:homoserine O-acetyltransferase